MLQVRSTLRTVSRFSRRSMVLYCGGNLLDTDPQLVTMFNAKLNHDLFEIQVDGVGNHGQQSAPTCRIGLWLPSRAERCLRPPT